MERHQEIAVDAQEKKLKLIDSYDLEENNEEENDNEAVTEADSEDYGKSHSGL
jgi:hypothetical protein